MIIDSSIPYHDLEAYFKTVKTTKVTLIKNPDRILGSIRIPSTTIRFEGDYVTEAVDDYRLRFLSAGGW